MSLADFLLARYAEDQDHLAGMACDCPPDDTAPGCATRLADDLAAKRAIVAMYDVDDDIVSFGRWRQCADDCPGVAMWHVIKLLAQPYRHHPDYQEDWDV